MQRTYILNLLTYLTLSEDARADVKISVVTKYVNDISRLNQSGICFNWYFGRHIDIDTAKMYLLFYKKGKLS